MATYYAQKVHFSNELSTLHFGGRLFQQYIVDITNKTQHNNSNFLLLNQVQLRVKLYQGLVDMVEHDVRLNPTQVGKRIILPASFLGSPHFMMQVYQDVMAIVRSKGTPDVFLTFTCNPNWQEIVVELKPNQIASNRLDLVACIF
jgi:hypothetical protein